MNEFLEILLTQINMPKENYSYFLKGTLGRIVAEIDNTKYTFNIKLQSTLPLQTYELFYSLINKKFKDIKEINIKIETIEKNYLLDYFINYLNSLKDDSYFLTSLKESQLILENDVLTIVLDSILLKNKIKEIEKGLLNYLEKCGFGSLTIKTLIEQKNDKVVQNMIEESLKIDTNMLNTTIKKLPENEIKKKNFSSNYERKPKITEDKPNVVFGREIKEEIGIIKNIVNENNSITVEGYVFADVDIRETKTDLKIMTLKITDYTDSIYAKIFINDDEDFKRLTKQVKRGKWFLFRGNVKDDLYSKELTLIIRDINALEKVIEERKDEAPIKRIELHTHTMMSQMDGLTGLNLLKHTIDIVERAIKWGHKAVAITDHNGCQAFPIAYETVKHHNAKIEKEEDKFKAIYGTELTLIDDTINLIIRPNDTALFENTYVVFDFETTGFNAGGGDSIIEVGAVKLLNGEIIDKFSELIDPLKEVSKKITEVTGITTEMVKGKDNEELVIKRFKDWFKDYPMVAHNAKFDVSFLEMAYQKYDLGEFTNPVLDTLELSRALDTEYSRHSLSALVKRYNIPFDENSHHRGDYDAEATAHIFHKMMQKLYDRGFRNLNTISNLIAKEEIHKFGRRYHVNLLAKNKIGLKNIFKIISLANTKYLYKTPRILRSELIKYHEGILIGSGCYESEIFVEAKSKSDEELNNLVKFYDYVEVQPIECYDHLIQMGDFASKIEIMEHIKKIIRVCKEADVMVVATGDVHHLDQDDKIYREIIINQKVPGGGRHPLSRNGITNIPSMHFRTTSEMLADFSFLDEELKNEIVIKNPQKIADMVEIIEVIIETGGIPFSPKIENSVQTVKDLVYNKAHSIYGNPLPTLIEDRIDQELGGIIKGGFDVIYLIAQKLVKKSNDDGYIVGSRGSVGSSFVATMMGITEVNPLSAHYICPKCQNSIFEIDGKSLGIDYSSGFDLPDMMCPKCNMKMIKEGQDMPFATFLGFDADKVPDIDLNFSGEYQWKAHEYTKELFGIDNVYRAGTIGTVADKTAYGYVKGYYEDRGITMRSAEIERMALGCVGVKRTTGQHPGGIVVIPDYMDVFDFSPFQYPADDNNSLWRTTHFEYHAIDQDVLKLDILGHDDPTVLRMLQDLSKTDVTKVPLDDKDTMSIFSSPDILGVTKEKIMCETGTLGIPEFGTKFVIGMLVDTRPKTFSELIKISGLSHGTDVWVGNAQDLIRNNIVPFKEVIGCRDDIMVYLMYHGLQPKKAFKIMEFVRKGKASKDPEGWKIFEEEMKEASIASWFIESCRKIKYMFPKAHAAAYVTSAYRIAYFKVHHPIWYYTAYFSIRCTDFDIESMIKGYDAIKEKMVEISNKGYEATNKDEAVLGVLEISLEAVARGIKFANVNLYKSEAVNFVIDGEDTLIPPFRTIDGLGDTVAQKIVEERKKGEFLSIEDLAKRCKVSGTIIDKLRIMKVLDGMDESSQLSLF
ncbi:MAG: PolC-type DNA polymerase III [Bacilli bacterium]